MKKNNKKSELVSIGKLANLSGLRASTIKFYTEIGILSFEQKEEGLRRHYDKTEAIERLNEIQKLKEEERLTIEEVKKHFKVTK